MYKCFKCEKDLEFSQECEEILDGAGYLEASFHYGSRHDQCIGFAGRKNHILRCGDDRLHQLLASDKLQAYICDDCFEKYEHLFEGYSVVKKIEEQKIV